MMDSVEFDTSSTPVLLIVHYVLLRFVTTILCQYYWTVMGSVVSNTHLDISGSRTLSSLAVQLQGPGMKCLQEDPY